MGFISPHFVPRYQVPRAALLDESGIPKGGRVPWWPDCGQKEPGKLEAKETGCVANYVRIWNWPEKNLDRSKESWQCDFCFRCFSKSGCQFDARIHTNYLAPLT